MKTKIKRVKISKNEEPIAKKIKEVIQKSVLSAPHDTRIKKFPKNLPVSNYVTIKPKKFKKMQYKYKNEK